MTSQTTDQRSHVDLVKHGEDAAQFYIDKPGLFQPATAVDLYHCIADLARDIRELRSRLDASGESK